MEDVDVGQDLQEEHTVELDEPADEDLDVTVEAASVTVGAETPRG